MRSTSRGGAALRPPLDPPSPGAISVYDLPIKGRAPAWWEPRFSRSGQRTDGAGGDRVPHRTGRRFHHGEHAGQFRPGPPATCGAAGCGPPPVTPMRGARRYASRSIRSSGGRCGSPVLNGTPPLLDELSPVSLGRSTPADSLSETLRRRIAPPDPRRELNWLRARPEQSPFPALWSECCSRAGCKPRSLCSRSVARTPSPTCR